MTEYVVILLVDKVFEELRRLSASQSQDAVQSSSVSEGNNAPFYPVRESQRYEYYNEHLIPVINSIVSSLSEYDASYLIEMDESDKTKMTIQITFKEPSNFKDSVIEQMNQRLHDYALKMLLSTWAMSNLKDRASTFLTEAKEDLDEFIRLSHERKRPEKKDFSYNNVVYYD